MKTEKKKSKMTPAQEAALAKARAAAAEKVKAAKALTEQPIAAETIEVIYRDISKRLDDMNILLKEIYNNMPTRLKTDWLK